MAEDTALLQEISQHLRDLKGHMAASQSVKTKPFFEDETITISPNKPWTLDYKGYHYVYVFSANGFTLTAEDLGTISVSANAWTPVNLQQGQRLTVSNSSFTFLARATDDLYSLGTSGGGGGGNSTIVAPLGTQVAANSVSVALASNSSPFSTQRVASTNTYTAGALNAQLVNAIDLSEYGYWSLQIAETAFVGTLTFYGSNDGTNWIGITVTNLNTNGTATSFTVAAGTPNSAFGGAATMRFLQVTMTSYSSGTATGILTLFGGDSQLSGSSGGGGNVTVVGPLGSQASTNGVSVTIASDQAAVAVKESGTWTVQPGNTPNTSAWLVQDVAATSGGSTPNHAISAASTNGTSLKASAGMIYGISISNTNAAARYFKIYNKASSPTVGTDTPVMTIQVPATSTVIRAFPVGLALSTGIAYAATGAMGDSDTTAIGAGDLSMDIDYK